MKIKITRNQLKKHYPHIFIVPYCDWQNLLSYEEPTYVNSGIYGWNYDGYHINATTCVVTGYRTFGTPVPREIVATYEEKAREIRKSNLTYSETKAALYGLLVSFVQEVIDTNK